MKKFVFILCCAMLLFVSCGNMTKEKTVQSKLNILLDAFPISFDPSEGSDIGGDIVFSNVLEPLVRVNEAEDGSPFFISAGAKSWSISEDNSTYTFILNNNFWHDGKPVRSYDYAFALRRNINPETACPYADMLYPIKNAAQIFEKGAAADSLGVQTPDEKTLIIQLEHPVPYFLGLLTLRSYFPQREDLVKSYGKNYGKTVENAAFCGPFIISKLVKGEANERDSIQYIKHQKFWNAAKVSIDAINCIIGNSSADDLKKGIIDTAVIADPKTRGELIRDSKYQYHAQVRPVTIFFISSCHEQSITRNAKIRRAVSASLDRYEYIDSIDTGIFIPANSVCSPAIHISSNIFTSQSEAPISKLLKEVKNPRALFIEGIQELGLGSDPSKVLITIARPGLSAVVLRQQEFIKQNLEAVLGCKVAIKKIANIAEAKKELAQGTYDIGYFGWLAGFDDPLSMLELFSAKSQTYNTGWINTAYEQLLEGARKEPDLNKRKAILQQMDNILANEQAVVMPIAFVTTHVFTRTYLSGVETYAFNTMGYQHYKIDSKEKEQNTTP